MEPFACDALPGRVVFGAGAARTELAGEVARLGVSRLLLIAGGGGESVARDLAAPLEDRIAGTFTGVRPHVPAEVADAARKQAAAVGADAVLSVGGGSATGTAKAVALTTGLPVIAVPTTYAGSEVTPVWGLTEGERKTTGVDIQGAAPAGDLRPGADPFTARAAVGGQRPQRDGPLRGCLLGPGP